MGMSRDELEQAMQIAQPPANIEGPIKIRNGFENRKRMARKSLDNQNKEVW